MIKTIIVSNFKSFGAKTRIELGAFTLLVGQNGAGKSNLVDLLRFLSDAMRMGLNWAIAQRGGIDAVMRRSASANDTLDIDIEMSNSSFTGLYKFRLARLTEGSFKVANEQIKVLYMNRDHEGNAQAVGDSWDRDEPHTLGVGPQDLALNLLGTDAAYEGMYNMLRNLGVYDIQPNAMREPQRRNPTRPMRGDGSNWGSVLEAFASEKGTLFHPIAIGSEALNDLTLGLHHLVSDVSGVRVVPISSFLSVQFQHDSEEQSKGATWADSFQESDGTLRIAGIFTALLQPEVRHFVIEEPELFIHPGAIRMVYDYLEQASRKSQVIVTTHSPDLLDAVRRPECIRVVTKVGGATVVGPVAEEQVHLVRERLMSLGELHRGDGLRAEGL